MREEDKATSDLPIQMRIIIPRKLWALNSEKCII